MLLEKLGTCKYQNGHMMQVSACTPAASTSAVFKLPFKKKKKRGQTEKLQKMYSENRSLLPASIVVHSKDSRSPATIKIRQIGHYYLLQFPTDAADATLLITIQDLQECTMLSGISQSKASLLKIFAYLNLLMLVQEVRNSEPNPIQISKPLTDLFLNLTSESAGTECFQKTL